MTASALQSSSVSQKLAGRAGELLQVFAGPGERLLVSGPVVENLDSSFRILPGPPGEPAGTIPEGSWKMERAIRLFLQKVQSCTDPIELIAAISYESSIPRGKGFGSSSADILGLLSLLNRWFGANLSDGELYRMAASIEPTDPLLHRGMVLFNSETGEALEELEPIGLTFYFFDSTPHRSMETPLSHDLFLDPLGRPLLNRFLDAWKKKDLAGIYQATEESALRSHRQRPRPGIVELSHLAREIHCGIFLAHTGTILGIYAPSSDNPGRMLPVIHNFSKRIGGGGIFSGGERW